MFAEDEQAHEENPLFDNVKVVLADLGVVTGEQAPASDAAVDLELVLDAGTRGRTRYAVMAKRGRLNLAT